MSKTKGLRQLIAGKAKQAAGEIIGDQERHEDGKGEAERGHEEPGQAGRAQSAEEAQSAHVNDGAPPRRFPIQARASAGVARRRLGLGRRSRWMAAAALGLISSTFSTIVSQLLAARIGRDAAVDWMTVAAIPARDWAISAEPSWSAILAGVAFHQWADFSWALVFFGVLGRWTADLRPLTILLLALPWAVFTSSMEWFVLVPLFPFWQPLFTLQRPTGSGCSCTPRPP